MDLNIIIGPNNCGKTSILRGIYLLQKINFGRFGNPLDCKICESFLGGTDSILSLDGEIGERERFLNKREARVVFAFDAEEIQRTIPHVIKDRDEILSGVLAHPDESQIRRELGQLRESKEPRRINDANEVERMYKAKIHASKEFGEPKISLKQTRNRKLRTEHLSFLVNQRFSEDVLKTIIFCPDARLDTYKSVDIAGYIRSKNLPTSQQAVMVQFLKDFVDLKLVDMRQNMELIRLVENTRFDTTIAEQGSGVKSVICLIADILAETQNKILLIDEPELGLNPSGKQTLLKFLLGQSINKQVFIATHDPTFVNPLLWHNQGVSVYVYSVSQSKFVKVNLEESKTDPSTFAGYLPHTTSLKQIHMYVEGSHDVYIFQIFLEKYVKKNFDNWYEILNRIGLYHLAGDFWSHLLYTIPEKPYFSMVILDGDKSELVGDVIKRYNSINKGRFQFFSSISEMRKLLHRNKKLENNVPISVICLQQSEIEDYLEPKPASKEHGPDVAQQMDDVPEEIAQIFSVMFQFAG